MATPAVEERELPSSEVSKKPKRSSTLFSFVGIAILLGACIGAVSLASTFIGNWAAQYENEAVPQTEPASEPTRQQPATLPATTKSPTAEGEAVEDELVEKGEAAPAAE